MIERLLRSALETEHSQDEIASCGTASEGRLCNFGSVVAPGAPSSATQQHNFWAKGTGFGSGTTQQQWNVDLHVMKRKQDEQNVTHLLRVLFCSIAEASERAEVVVTSAVKKCCSS